MGGASACTWIKANAMPSRDLFGSACILCTAASAADLCSPVPPSFPPTALPSTGSTSRWPATRRRTSLPRSSSTKLTHAWRRASRRLLQVGRAALCSWGGVTQDGIATAGKPSPQQGEVKGGEGRLTSSQCGPVACLPTHLPRPFCLRTSARLPGRACTVLSLSLPTIPICLMPSAARAKMVAAAMVQPTLLTFPVLVLSHLLPSAVTVTASKPAARKRGGAPARKSSSAAGEGSSGGGTAAEAAAAAAAAAEEEEEEEDDDEQEWDDAGGCRSMFACQAQQG